MTVIEFINVSKCFKIYQNKSYSMKEQFINKLLKRHKLQITKHDVLKDATFKIQQGETIGIIGENGTGKSTTLKLISKILYPDSGEIIVNGKISALLEIGAGFQPDLTGKENVFLYGSILGLSKEEISSKYNDIVKFAELEEFMDTPVKNYSSGMYMRLAFAVAINVDPDILVIDEVLAVGDEVFQKKCIDKILNFKRQKKTIVFVSHDMDTIRKICDRVYFIKKGGYVIEGTPDQMVNLYMKLVYAVETNDFSLEAGDTEKSQSIDNNTKDSKESHKYHPHEALEFIEENRYGNRKVEITSAIFSNNKRQEVNNFYTEEDINISINLKKNMEVTDAVVGFAIYSEEGWHLVGHNCRQDGYIITDIKDYQTINLSIKNNKFIKGKYYLTISLHNADETDMYDYRDKHYFFNIIEGEKQEFGKVRIECDWELK